MSLLRKPQPQSGKIEMRLAGTRVVLSTVGKLNSDQFGAYLTFAKRNGFKFDGAEKCWYIGKADLRPHIIEQAQQAGYEIGSGIAPMVAPTTSWKPSPDIRSFPYQVEGIHWLYQQISGIVGDEMGLGKTSQALQAIDPSWPVLVVAPKAAKAAWPREAKLWAPQLTNVVVIKDRKDARLPKPGEVVVLNYEQLGALDPNHVADRTLVIADEFHLVKNWKAQRTQNMRELVRRAFEVGGRLWAFTGTPVLNRPQELWGILQTAGLARRVFPGGYDEFRQMCGGVEGRYGLEFHAELVDPSVSKRLESVMLRRLRRDVFPQMSPKIYTTVTTALPKSLCRQLDEIYTKAFADANIPALTPDEVMDRLNKAIEFTNFSSIRAALASSKIPAMLEIVDEYEQSGEPLVVVSAHRAPIDIFKGRSGWAVITGDTSAEERGRIQDDFQSGKLIGVALTIRAGGVGISLTRACQMLMVDLDFSPGLNAQAEDRLRPHLKKQSCQYTTLVADHALDAMVAECLRAKQQMIGNLMGEEVERTYEDLVFDK